MQYFLSKNDFQTFLCSTNISRLDKLLLVLFWEDESPKTVKKIKELASENGLRECSKWNVSDILGRAKGRAVLIKGSWVLTIPGRTYLSDQGLLKEQHLNTNDAKDLRSYLLSISNAQTRGFLEEAICSFEADLRRAAVVLSWVGAIAVLHDEVVKNYLVEFNQEALKKDSKWKQAKTTDDLSRMKEFDFLNILEAISIIGKNVKQELHQCLQLRNGCGHPNSLNIGSRRVAAHIEVLTLNVFSKF